MAKIDVKAVVTAPSEITIPLVRADHHQTSNVFRVAFEVFLALFGGLMGHVLSIDKPEVIHFLFLGVCGFAAVIFLCCSLKAGKKSKDV